MPQLVEVRFKGNRKAYRSALRGALSSHASEGTLAVVDKSAFDEPSTKKAAAFLESWGQERPVLVVATWAAWPRPTAAAPVSEAPR